MPATQPVAGTLGPLEAEVMTVLWSHKVPMTVREVRTDVNAGREAPLAYTTVMTVLARLAEKGILSRERQGRGYRYEPLVGDHASIAVREVVRGFGEAAVAGFVDEARADPKLLRRLRALLAEET